MHDPLNLAYLDPVSGSTVFQLVIASTLTVLTSVRSVRSAVGDFFRRLRGRPRDNTKGMQDGTR